MNRDDILRMAREAGFDVDKKDGAYEAFEDNGYYIQTDRVIKFAALVAAAERERIKVANSLVLQRINEHLEKMREDIRARGQA